MLICYAERCFLPVVTIPRAENEFADYILKARLLTWDSMAVGVKEKKGLLTAVIKPSMGQLALCKCNHSSCSLLYFTHLWSGWDLRLRYSIRGDLITVC